MEYEEQSRKHKGSQPFEDPSPLSVNVNLWKPRHPFWGSLKTKEKYVSISKINENLKQPTTICKDLWKPTKNMKIYRKSTKIAHNQQRFVKMYVDVKSVWYRITVVHLWFSVVSTFVRIFPSCNRFLCVHWCSLVFTYLFRLPLIAIDCLWLPLQSAEELNMRPAQWLGFLKLLAALGAEYFYTGFFSPLQVIN